MSESAKRAQLTVLMDDTVNATGLRAEHGLSFLLERDGHTALFDCGQTDLFAGNAQALKKDLAPVEAIVLSHGHYDHTGGLPRALALAEGAAVHAHPDVRILRYAKRRSGEFTSVGMPRGGEDIPADRLRLSAEPVEIVPGVWTTGEVPRLTDFEDTGGPFFLDGKGIREDGLVDDLSIFFESGEGTVLLLGCAHAGVVNILNRVADLTGRRSVHTVIGGMHLGSASEERVERTCEAFEEFGVVRLGPTHCTGMPATVRFMSRFPDGAFLCPTGTSVLL